MLVMLGFLIEGFLDYSIILIISSSERLFHISTVVFKGVYDSLHFGHI